ncbi:MAG: response regulator [Spirosomataceae bacterium]
MKKLYKILIADDHLLFLESMALLLDSLEEVELVDKVSNGKEVLKKLNDINIDILLCDYRMPEMDGIELAFQLREKYPAIKIILLTGSDDLDGIRKAVQAGVKGVLSKNISKNELQKAINAIGEGFTYFSNDIMQILTQFPTVEKNTPNEALSDRELEVLKLISQSHTGVQIADKLNISHHTVESHRKNLFRKIGVNSTYALIKYAMQNGINP